MPGLFGHHSSHRHSRRSAQKPKIPQFWINAAIIASLGSLFAFFVTSHARVSSATYDETTHLPAGYSYWQWKDFRLNPEHPPFVKQLAAIPLLWFQVWPSHIELTRDDVAQAAVVTSSLRAKRAWALGLADVDAQWLFGHALLYGVKDEALRRLGVSDALAIPGTAKLHESDFFNDADALLFWGRMPILALGLFLAVLVFLWARDLFGLAGGVLALTLFCFDPNFIAHSGLVTTDVGISLFMFGTVYFFWRLCRRIEAVSVALMLLFFGLAFVTKFSAILLAPILVLVGLGRIFSVREWPIGSSGRFKLSTRLQRALALGGLTVAALLIAYGMVWLVYGFRYSAASDPARAVAAEALMAGGANLGELAGRTHREPGHLPIEWAVRRTAAIKSLLKQWPKGVPEDEIQKAMGRTPIGLSGKLILFAQRHRLLPEAYLYGFAHAEMKSQMRGSFLGIYRAEADRYSNVGFRSYFFWTFLFKTPLPTIAAICLAVYFVIRRREPWRSRLAFLVIPVVVYFAVSTVSHLNIGHRHLLPVYPFLFVLCGCLGAEWSKWNERHRKHHRRPRLATKQQLVGAAALGLVAFSSLVVLMPPWKPAVVYPHYLAYFNELAGGPRNGYRLLVDSNLDWGQDLKKLKQWLKKEQYTEPIYLCYFGMADPRYYQIPHYNMPGGYQLGPQQPFAIMRSPGYIAISATNLQGVYFGPEGRQTWRRILEQTTLIDTVGYSIFIYRIGPPH